MTKEAKKSYKVYFLGNPYVEKDSFVYRIVSSLRESFKDVSFVEIDPSENLPEEENLLFLDTIINTENIQVLKDLENIQPSPNFSLHDFDLGSNLKLLKKVGKIKDFTIIGIPPNHNDDLLSELKVVITNLLSKTENQGA